MKKILLLTALILLAACSRNSLQVVETNIPENGEIADRQNITIKFNKDLVSDSLLYKWDTTSYLKITPAVQGSYQWTSKNTLSFSPASAFEPNTDYKLELTENLFKHSIKMGLPSNKIYSFHTEYFKMKDVLMRWFLLDSLSREVGLQASILFSQKMNPSEMEGFLNVEINSQKQEFKILSVEPDQTIIVGIKTSNISTPENASIKFILKKGCPLYKSSKKNGKDIELESTVPGKDKLEITGVRTGNDISDLHVEIITNQELAADQDLTKFISFKPSLNFTAEQNSTGIWIKGNFDANKIYEVTISGKLRGILGKALENDYSTSVTFNDIAPLLKFDSENGMYLTSKGARNLGVQIYGTPKITVSVVKVYENNILLLNKRNKRWGYDYTYDEENDVESEWHDYEYYETQDLGDEIFTKDYNTSDLPSHGGMYLLNLDFKDVIKKYDGMYVVKVAAKDKKWLQDSRIVCLSDLGIVAKKSGQQLLVYVNSIKGCEPVSGAKVKLISTNNQEFSDKETDAQGIVIFDLKEDAFPKFDPGLISVKKDGDVNYMVLDYKTLLDKSKFPDLGGINGRDYKTFLYGDRNIYRPDDTLVIAGIVRDSKWGTLKNMPIKLELLLPNSKKYREIKTTLNDEGGFSEKMYLPRSLVTGIYNIRASLMNGTVLQTRTINIEDFIPDRIKFELKADKESYTVPSQIDISTTVLNLYGPPAANKNYDFKFNFRIKDFTSREFKDYTFRLQSSSDRWIDELQRSGKTDAEGKVNEIVDIGSDLANLGLINGIADLTVFDETGRTVSRNLKLNIYTQDAFNGIGDFDSFVGTGKTMKMPVISLDKNGKVLNNHKVKIQIVRKYWETVLRSRGSNNYVYESQLTEKVVMEKMQTISGDKFLFSYAPDLSGSYEIRVSNPEAQNYVARTFYAYSWGGVQSNSFEVNSEGKINIALDKPSYKVGETAKVLFKTPFKGKLLVTMERDGVMDYKILETDNKAAELTFEVKKEYLPNIFISATLIKPHNSDDIPLTVAYGYVPLIVEETANKLPVDISVNEKSRSRTKQRITVTTKPMKDIYVTVAAVDEGILQIKNFKTPDPYAFFYQKIGLGTETYSIYPYLFPELKMQNYRYGSGDEDDYDLSKRTNPLTAKRVKLLAYWSGVLKTNAQGKATYDIEIPEFSGSVRVMACAYKDKAFGSAEKNIVVADPLVVSTALPRFMSPGDVVETQFTLANTTNKKATVKANVSLSGPIQIMEGANTDVTIEPNTEKQVKFTIKALNEIGNTKITVNADAFGEHFTQSTEMSVRPSTSLLKTDLAGEVNPGERKDIPLNDKFIKESVASDIVVSKSPMIQFAKDFRYLVQYPYGCVEQTVSTAFPQLAYSELVKMSMSGNDNTYVADAKDNVRFAIDKLQSMQLPSGGLSMWLGDPEESWWGTAYAGHFLTECKKNGYNVSLTTLENIFKYLKQKVSGAQTTYYYYFENGHYVKHEYYQREAIYSLLVMAIGGRPDVSLMNHYKSKPSLLTDDSKMMLAASYRIAGAQREYSELIPQYKDAQTLAETGGSFSSDVRNLALALYTLQIADPNNKQLNTLAKHLSDKLMHTRYLSTQDRSFGLIALSNTLKGKISSEAKADIYLDGNKKTQLAPADDSRKLTFKNEKVSIQNTGKGTVYYFAQREGLDPSGKYEVVDNYLKVRKKFYDVKGNEISGSTFKQGQLVVVKITLESLYDEPIKNIVVTDMLPAGFEIENPRLNEDQQYAWIKDADQPQHYDYRDDRINIFCDLGVGYNYNKRNNLRTFYYVVRAVTKGKFVMGPVSADAMYNGEYRSYNGGGKVTVE